MLTTLLGGGGAVTLLSLMYAAIYQPWSKEAKLKRQQKKIVNLFIAGDSGTKGLIEKILPAPERMANVEHACAENEQTLKEHDDRIAANSRIISEHGTTLTAIQEGVMDLTNQFVAFRDENARNGGDGPGFGDTLSRIAKALGVDVALDKKES